MSDTTPAGLQLKDSAEDVDRSGLPPLLPWVWTHYLRRYRGLVAIAIVLMVIQGAMLGALSKLVEPMFDQIFVAGDRRAVWWVSLGIAGTFFVRATASFGQRAIMSRVGLDIIAAMQKDMTRHLLTLDSAFFRANPVGTLIERVRGDTTVANQIWNTILAAGAREFIALISLLAVAISIDPVWALIAIAGIPLLLGPVFALQRYVRKKTRMARTAAGVISTRLDETFHGVDTIKLNTSEARENARFESAVARNLRQEWKSNLGQAAIPSLTDVVGGIAFFAVLTYGGFQIIDGEKTVGEFMSFFTALGLLFEPIRQISRVFGAWQQARASLERIQDVLHLAPSITSSASPRAAPERPETADVVFDNVVVRYGGEPALNGASFTAKAGATTALVGASGAGKSTIFNVLTRLIDPSEGRVFVGGVATVELSLPDLRALFSVVTQDAPMFDESLRDNIVLSTSDVTDDMIRNALDAAHLTAFVEGLPYGLDTRVGPRGAALSGGQRQRVAIARAVLRDAPILLLDEATSALDAESEVRVQEALDRLAEGRTTLVIAHRLSTVRSADKIVVLDHGRVADEGSHAELVQRGGLYAHLHALQFRDA